MKPHTLASSRLTSPAKLSFALACLLIQFSAQAADPPDKDKDKNNHQVVTPGTPAKQPSKHHEVVRGPVKPKSYPTKPQGQVRRLR